MAAEAKVAARIVLRMSKSPWMNGCEHLLARGVPDVF
jgi:hypothetical protein